MVARCTVARLMRAIGLAAVCVRGQKLKTTIAVIDGLPVRIGSTATSRQLGRTQLWVVGSDLRGDLVRVRLRRLRHRRVLRGASSAGVSSSSLRTDLALDALEQALYERAASDEDAWSITATVGCSTSRSVTPSAWPRPASSRRSAASATPTTTRWPSRSSDLFKTEVIGQRGPWRHLEAVEFATLEWVDWFNNRRLLEPIGDIPPAEFEEVYYRQSEESAMAA